MNEQTETAESRLAKTVFIVAANDFEILCLWQQHSKESLWSPKDRSGKLVFEQVKWEQVNPGWLVPVGKVGKLPNCISTQWARINGHLVMFYYSCSRVTDSLQVEKWLEKHFKGKWDDTTRRASTDAMNFGHCLSAIRKLSQPKDSQ